MIQVRIRKITPAEEDQKSLQFADFIGRFIPIFVFSPPLNILLSRWFAQVSLMDHLARGVG
jgi:hypothetical protein